MHCTDTYLPYPQAPVYFLPPVLMTAIPPLRNALMKNPRLNVPVTTLLLLIAFGAGLPATVALFPQISAIAVEDVEEEFQKFLRDKGDKRKFLYYDKGL